MRWLSVLLILAACSSDTNQSFEMPPVPVQTAVVKRDDVPLYFEAIGIIKPFQMAEVKSQVTGMITAVHFEEGVWVEEGALLYTIDEAPYKIQAREAEAMLAQNIAHVKNAQKKLERYQSLSNPDLIAPVEWDELQTKIALHESMARADMAKLEAARLGLERCHILAPIAGRAGRSALQVGNMTSADSLVKLSQMNPLYVDFEMTPSERQKLPEKARAEVYIPGEGECIAAGHVTFVGHEIDPKSGMTSARAVLTDIQTSLLTQQSVCVRLFFGEKKGAMLIPLRAIKTNQQGPYVFLVKDDKTVEVRPVQLGPEDKGLVAVDLEEGKVVIEGHMKLFPGAKVEEVL
jgi:multidrug efflux system membrane fusion protein